MAVANPEPKVLGLELLAHNFYESLEVGRLIKRVRRQVDEPKDPQSGIRFNCALLVPMGALRCAVGDLRPSPSRVGSEEVKEIAWKTQNQLHKRYQVWRQPAKSAEAGNGSGTRIAGFQYRVPHFSGGDSEY
jgi:hypothetical protein